MPDTTANRGQNQQNDENCQHVRRAARRLPSASAPTSTWLFCHILNRCGRLERGLTGEEPREILSIERRANFDVVVEVDEHIERLSCSRWACWTDEGRAWCFPTSAPGPH